MARLKAYLSAFQKELLSLSRFAIVINKVTVLKFFKGKTHG